MSSRQYLELMGIDVWRRRPPRRVRSEIPAVAEANTSSIEQVKQSLGGMDEPSLTTKALTTKALTTKAVATKPERQPAESPSQPPIVEAGPSFLVVFANFAGLSFASHYSADLAGIPQNHQRFLASFYFAMTGEKTSPQVFDFRWPMVKSKHISQSKEEAAAVMQQSLQRLSNQVLVFGEEAYGLFNVQNGEPYQSALVNGKTLWLFPELETFFVSPGKRRAMWQSLGGLRRQLSRE